MNGFKALLKDNSKFRISYLVVLFFCNIAFVQIPAYICLVFLFFWGVYVAYNNIRYNHCLERLRFGLWILAFLGVNFLTMLINISTSFVYNLIMFLHISICFFVFYGIHTEQNFNSKSELCTMCKFIIYATSILGIIGFIFMMCGVKFEIWWIKFIIYENRYTGVYINPNILGFISVVSIVCCHIITRHDFLAQANQKRISRIAIAVCLCVDLFSLLLCDSNASLVLCICYVVVMVVFNFFSMSASMSKKQMLLKALAVFFAALYIAGAVLFTRMICQRGFSHLLSSKPVTTTTAENIASAGEDIVTFSHTNKNIDSGRIKLIRESVKLFKISPVFGISNGNIILYSQEYLDGTMSLSYHNNDLHNGYLTILVSTGVVGFCIFAVFGLRFAKHIASNLFKRQNAHSQDILPCLFAFCCAYLVYSLFEKALLYDISFMVMWFWYMIGVTGVYLNKYEPLIESQYMLYRNRLPRHMI
jgi:hypothetical protein